MEKKVPELSYKVRGDFSPNGLQKVFCSFHPGDKELMEHIVNDILSLEDCAVFFHTDSYIEQEIDLEDFAMRLSDMKLFVVIVTTNYLVNDSFSKQWEYKFAMEHRIPILPVATESGLENFFEAEMNRIGSEYGNIQLLKSVPGDQTDIPYSQKLVRDLGSVLTDVTERDEIKRVFSGKIFLSYRKKDRKYANELMRTIHSIPSLQYVSIWYDEFISTGEKWSNQIRDSIRDCDIFLLLVTPSITEPDNYVITMEYPEARKYQKKIIAVTKEESCPEPANREGTDCDTADRHDHGEVNPGMPDRKELQQLFPGLEEPINGNDTGALEDALKKISLSGSPSPKENYLIGRAFFDGVEVERDIDKAVSLIVDAARQGLCDAVKKLADMYWMGDGITINYENAVHWNRKLINIYEKKISEVSSPLELTDHFEALSILTSRLYELSALKEAYVYGKRLVFLAEGISALSESSAFYPYLRRAYDLCGKICRWLSLFEDEISYMEKHLEILRKIYESDPDIVNLHNLAVGYERMGDTCYVSGYLSQAEKWYQQALDIYGHNDTDLKSIRSAGALASGHNAMGDVYIRKGAYETAHQHFYEAAVLRKRILDAENTYENREAYALTLLSCATAMHLQRDIKNAEKLFLEALDILESICEDHDTMETQHACSVALNRCGSVCLIQEKYSEALEYYSNSLSHREKILSRINTPTAIYEYSLTLYYMGEVYRKKYDDRNACRYYREVVERLMPILPKDRNGDWHSIFAFASFELFKQNTFMGRSYLQNAIETWKWMSERWPGNEDYSKKYEQYRLIYERCYPYQF